MLSRIRNIRNDPLVRGSFILLIMLGIYNILNYVFQISMARLLGPADYGVLAVLMSIVYILTIPSEAIQTVITKYTSSFSASNSPGKIKDLLLRGIRKSVLFSSVIFVVCILISFFISYILKIEIWLVIIMFLMIFMVFLMPINRGALQGRKKFTSLGFNLIIEAIVKVIFSITLVVIGWKVYGAMVGLLLGCLISFLAAFFPIRGIISAKRERAEFSKIYKTNFPIMAAMVSVVLMYSMDIIFARAFFSPETAGQFAFVSLIGKVIIFTSSAIGKALFPLSSEEFEKGKSTLKLFKRALMLVSGLAIFSLFIYYLFPKEIIYIISLGSSQYLAASGILLILGLAYSFLSVSNIIILYKLSINKIVKRAYFLLIFAVIEIVLLFLFNSSLTEFSISLLISNLLIFLYSLFLVKE